MGQCVPDLITVIHNCLHVPACHLFAQMNNIKPFTQALVNAVTGKKLTLQDQLESIDGNPKIHQYRTMKGNPDYYVKAKSITCAGAGQCKPVKCAMEVPSSTPMPPPIMISPPVSPPPVNAIPVVYDGEVCACKMVRNQGENREGRYWILGRSKQIPTEYC